MSSRASTSRPTYAVTYVVQYKIRHFASKKDEQHAAGTVTTCHPSIKSSRQLLLLSHYTRTTTTTAKSRASDPPAKDQTHPPPLLTREGGFHTPTSTMWGSSFADLARKAQELQDQAASAASHLSVSDQMLCVDRMLPVLS